MLLNEGDVLAAVEAGAGCCFIVGAMALGLATARFIERAALDGRALEALHLPPVPPSPPPHNGEEALRRCAYSVAT